MTNFSLSRIAPRASLLAALALGPFVVAAGCNVYSDVPSGQAGQAGSSAGAGNGATAGNQEFGAQSAGAAAGSDDGGAAPVGGTQGGSGGTSGGGSSGASGGGAGGTAGSGGVGGGGSGGGGTAGAASGNTELIDDMEDDDAQITISGDGRNGFWYDGGDDTPGAMLEPSGTFAMSMLMAGDRSSFAARLKATGYKAWGSVMGFNFVEFQGVKVYDASAYCGIQFWGKAASAVTVRFRVPDVDTHPVGMVCNMTDKPCYDHFGASAGFTTDWKLFSVPFTALMQIGTGYHPAGGFKSNAIVAAEWALPVNASKAYEIWIDDVAFLKCK